MSRDCNWALLGFVVVACVLPKAEIDDTLAPGAGGTGATGGSGGSGGKGGSGAIGAAGEFGEEAREFACDGYCTTYFENCEDAPPNTYDSVTDCLTTCFSSDWPFGADTAQPNSIQCRSLHATLAAGAQDPHCFHSAEVPTKTTCALTP